VRVQAKSEAPTKNRQRDRFLVFLAVSALWAPVFVAVAANNDQDGAAQGHKDHAAFRSEHSLAERPLLHKEQQNALGEKMRMLATAYTHAHPKGDINGTGDGITASGTRVRPGVIAVDPDVIPYGTLVYIEGLGYFRAEDTGGLIRRNRIDVFVESPSRALEFGRQWVDVDVIGPVNHPGASPTVLGE